MKFETIDEMTFTCENCAGWDIDKSELRNSIIADIKEISKDGFDERPKIFNMPIEVDPSLPEDTIRLDTREVSRIMIQKESDLVVRYLMMKFNITEEELL